ncbi:T9SS type A sorting domain-containing protein [bacterium]|nr:T9SS type A sorting domain-containing protein [bacterium]
MTQKGMPRMNRFSIVFKRMHVYSLLAAAVFSASGTDARDAVIDLGITHQIIRGYGAANILQWRPDMTDSEIETAFGTDDGQLGFTILRLRIQPETNLWMTNIPTAQKARDMGAIIIAAPWDPPADMLETVNGIKRVRYDSYEDYAYYLDDFRIFMEDNDVPLYGISVQNEPDITDSWTSWTADEMLTFMRDYAHIILETRVMAPESFQFRRSMSDPILNDAQACANTDIICGHIYGGGLKAYPLAESKGKEVWMTEHLSGENSNANDWYWAFSVATEIHGVMHAGMNAYIWWYIVRYYGPISDGTNNSGKKGDVTKKGYVMSQFSRFIRPGYFRVESDKTPQAYVYLSAYRDGAGSKAVIVAINSSSNPREQSFVFQNGHAGKVTPYVTSETKDCQRETDIYLSGDTLTATLDAGSITTFVADVNEVVSVGNASDGSSSFVLGQNYPNPFNPSTHIGFEIPGSAFVSLKVYNTLGQEIAELGGKVYAAGMHTVNFGASGLPGGIYFYTLRTGNFTQTRKMFLMR